MLTNANNKVVSSNNVGNGKMFLNDDDDGLINAPKSLAVSDVLEKYKEAVLHYGKYRHAGVIETEASIKAVQVNFYKIISIKKVDALKLTYAELNDILPYFNLKLIF